MKKELWLRLKHYHFDNLVPAHLADHVLAAFGGADASTKAFASKLARKLNWSTPFALRAIDEYKKFVYLGVVSDFAVTPPKVIDQVWHEHLLFSRAYRDFCREVLSRDFDHNPELVATPDQTDVFQTQYAATIDLYRAEFHTNPPVEFWGTPKFKLTGVATKDRKPKKLEGESSAYGGDPLWTYFDGSGGDHGHSHSSMAEFGGGGGFSGAGTSGSWGDAHSISHGHGDAASGHADSGSGDSGGGDGGGGDGGGSGCSSGCGGGGCGS